jgi:hypothetical protein
MLHAEARTKDAVAVELWNTSGVHVYKREPEVQRER